MSITSLRRRALFGAAALPLLPFPALGQSWPDRPIRMLVGFAAGGPTDTVPRIAGQGMGEFLGQPVAVGNRTGAAGNIASEATARAPADGHTIMMVNVGQIVINPRTCERMRVDPMRDLVPVALSTVTGLIPAIHPSLGNGNHAELVARLQRETLRHKFATSGAGGISHVVCELWRQRVQVQMEPIHFRGAAAMTPEMLAGRTPIGLDTTQQFDQHIRAGSLRGVVNLGGRPSRLQPNIPLAAQVGLAGGDMIASASTPEDLRARTEREFALYGEAIRRAEIRAE